MYVHKAYKKELYEKEFKVYYDAIMGAICKVCHPRAGSHQGIWTSRWSAQATGL